MKDVRVGHAYNALLGSLDRRLFQGSTLVVMPSVPVVSNADTVFADEKMIAGAKLYAQLWDGPVLFLVRAGRPDALAFGQHYDRASLPFRIEIVADDASDVSGWLTDAAAVLASGDNFRDFHVAEHTSAPVVFVIEYTLETRLQMIRLEQGLTYRALKSVAWTLLSERKRRIAFAASFGIQANGQPAFDTYGSMGRTSIRYFDTRITTEQQVSTFALTAKQRVIKSGQPLRLAFSGRLEVIKGADHLIPIAVALKNRGVAYTLDIFGDGSLHSSLQAAVEAAGLAGTVRLHGAVPFEDELVPYMKGHVDLFVCPHMQSDPSCTYLETLSCGVPIVGYENAAFKGVLGLGEAGVAVPIGSSASAAEAIAKLDADRSHLASLVDTAAAIGRANTFEKTFAARVEHLKQVALLSSRNRMRSSGGARPSRR